MNKIQFYHPWLITFLIILFLLSEIGWTIHIYQIEKLNFHTKIEQVISSSIEDVNGIYQDPPFNYYMDLTQKGRVIMEYSRHGSHFYTDTISEEINNLLNRLLYDFRKENWNLDTLAQCFKRNISSSEIEIIFTRKDKDNQLIDQYPAFSEVNSHPIISLQLGNTDIHYLEVSFSFPFYYFWQCQKYGLLLSLFILLLVLYYGLLILKKMRMAQHALRLIDKQTIFIHDLKTPLCTNRDIETRILQNANQWPPEKIREKLEIAFRQSEKLLDDLREATAFSAGHWGGEIQNQTFNLQKALEELIAFRQEGLENADISLDFQLDNPVICADPFHFVHIVDNFIGNAAKHADGKVAIRITCRLTEQHELSISVKDNGPGIPDHIQKHVFKSGFRHKSENKESQGLGLAYIRDIVRQYAGRIEMLSHKGEGTEFTMVVCPEKFRQQSQKNISNRIYPCVFACLLLAEMFWFANLYIAERSAFIHREGKIIDKAAFQTSREFFEWQDTACFRNNWAEKTITITRGQRDTTLPWGNRNNEGYLHRRLAYDLRDSYWQVDSLLAYYQGSSKNTGPVSMTRTTSAGRIIDAAPSPAPDIFLPVHFDMPLGFVEGHQLHVQLAFPWQQPLASHSGWLLLTLSLTLLCGWFTYLLAILTRRQQAFVRFQRNEVQFLIRKLRLPLVILLRAEKNMHFWTKQHIVETIPGNLETYRQTLAIINHLLERLTIIKIHPLILTESHGN